MLSRKRFCVIRFLESFSYFVELRRSHIDTRSFKIAQEFALGLDYCRKISLNFVQAKTKNR